MALGWDHPSQEVQKIGGEERVTGKILETEGRPFHDVNLLEAHVEKLFQQHWFHQCSGQSAGQGGRAFEHRFRQGLRENEIGDRHPSTRAHHAKSFG